MLLTWLILLRPKKECCAWYAEKLWIWNFGVNFSVIIIFEHIELVLWDRFKFLERLTTIFTLMVTIFILCFMCRSLHGSEEAEAGTIPPPMGWYLICLTWAIQLSSESRTICTYMSSSVGFQALSDPGPDIPIHQP